MMELSIGRELLAMGTLVLAIASVLWLLARTRRTTQ
jgi:hypothetical protein